MPASSWRVAIPPATTTNKSMPPSAAEGLYLGLISGTSADGIDVALARVDSAPPRLRARLENFTTVPYPAAVRRAIQYAAARTVLVVCAASEACPEPPAAGEDDPVPNLLAVLSIDESSEPLSGVPAGGADLAAGCSLGIFAPFLAQEADLQAVLVVEHRHHLGAELQRLPGELKAPRLPRFVVGIRPGGDETGAPHP